MLELGGTSWWVDGVAGARIDFADGGTLSGSAGVNRFRGTYAVDGDVLRLGPLATTRMAGAPDAMAREQQLLGVLGGPLRMTDMDGVVTLDDGTARLRLMPRPVDAAEREDGVPLDQ